jgi:cellulose synthase/poly-beta-1,6-N-acetylglucosamine synthase-like glycosyltransferase
MTAKPQNNITAKQKIDGESFVSFIVIAYNEEANIARTLSSIVEQNDLGKHEVVVVDDGSRDTTAQIVADVAEQRPAVRLIKLPRNRGRGYARATGIAAAHGELIAMVDADIILPADWLVRTRSALADHDAVGGIAVPDGDVAYICRRFKLVPRVVLSTASVTGNNGLYRRNVFDVANFDAELREGEDNALNFELSRQGLSLVTVPELLVRHEENKTLPASLKWLFDTGRGATRQLITYGEVRQPDLVTGAFVGTAVLGLVLKARNHGLVGTAIPVCFVLASGVQHVRTRFETPRSHWSRVAPAMAVDSAHLAAYFGGRLVGLTALWRRADPE